MLRLKLQSGQSLIEVLVALTIASVVIGALVVATIISIRNAQFSQNQLQATKLSQDGMEKVRIVRDRNLNVDLGGGDQPFKNLWGVNLATTCGCYFKVVSIINPITSGSEYKLQAIGAAETDNLSGNFTRQILITDSSTSFSSEKKVRVKVSWSDLSGSHDSHLETILTKQ